MYHLYSPAKLKLTLGFIVWMTSATASAFLIDCTESSGVACASVEPLLKRDQAYAVEEDSPAPPLAIGLAGYQVDQTRAPGALPESAPLLVLISGLLAVVLVRAKSHNNK